MSFTPTTSATPIACGVVVAVVFATMSSSRGDSETSALAPEGDDAREAGEHPTSTRLSKDLKKRGWSFVGPTTVYAFMQAMGLVNDHLEGCDARPGVEAARRALGRPRGVESVS